MLLVQLYYRHFLMSRNLISSMRGMNARALKGSHQCESTVSYVLLEMDWKNAMFLDLITAVGLSSVHREGRQEDGKRKTNSPER